jgi:hypothetical protein
MTSRSLGRCSTARTPDGRRSGTTFCIQHHQIDCRHHQELDQAGGVEAAAVQIPVDDPCHCRYRAHQRDDANDRCCRTRSAEADAHEPVAVLSLAERLNSASCGTPTRRTDRGSPQWPSRAARTRARRISARNADGEEYGLLRGVRRPPGTRLPRDTFPARRVRAKYSRTSGRTSSYRIAHGPKRVAWTLRRDGT